MALRRIPPARNPREGCCSMGRKKEMIERKNMELHLFVLQERKNIFLVRQISEQQPGAVMAFIPDQISVNDGALVVIRGLPIGAEN